MRRPIWTHPALWIVGLLVWAATLYLLSSRALPANSLPRFPHADKAAHLLYFTVGSFCFGRLLRLQKPAARASLIVLACLLFAAAAGALDELHQSRTPGRSGNDIGDLIADSLGGLLGGWLACALGKRRTQAA